MIELSLLAQLVAFADCGTLSAAAEHLHTSQPSLTRAMRRLEGELNLTLFVRGKNHIALTPTGEMAVHYARRVLTEAEEFETRIRAYDRSLRTITIGFCAPVPQMILPPLLNTIFEGMTISADMKDDADFFDRLADGSYQLAVTHLPPEDTDTFHAKKCGSEDLFLSLPSASPLAFYPELSLRHLEDQTILILNHIGFWMNAVCAKTIHTRYIFQTERDTLTELAANSSYPVFQSSYFIARGETVVGRINVPLTDAECHTDYYLVCLRKDERKYRRLFAKIDENTVR